MNVQPVRNGLRNVTRFEPADRFKDVVVPHLGDALALARWLTGSKYDAEDVVQDSCIRALSGLAAYEGRADRAWLLTIVRNTCFTWLAKNRPKSLVLAGSMSDLDTIPAHDLDGADASPETELIQKAEDAAVQRAIDAIPVPFREVLVLRDINGLSYKEIASMLKMPIGTVMSRLARARSLVAAEIGRVTS